MNRKRWQRLSVMLAASSLVLLAFGLRLWGLNATSLWYDETFMLAHARHPLLQGLSGLFQEDNALPLYGLLLALWIRAAGAGEFAVRYLSVLLGTLAAPLILRLGRAVAGRSTADGGHAGPPYTGLGSALAYAVLPICVYYSQEVRMYALALPVTAAFLWIAWRLVDRGHGTVAYVGLGLATLLAHPYAGLAWASAAVWGTLTLSSASRRAPSATPLRRQGARLAVWLRANLILAVVALPVVLWALWRVRADATAVSAIPLDALRWLPILFGVGQYLSPPWPGVFAALALLSLLAAGIAYAASGRYRSLLWLVTTLILPIMALFLLTSIKAKWSERYLLPSWGIALATGIGLGWEALAQARPRVSRSGRAAMGAGALLLLGTWAGIAFPALARQAQGTWAVALRDEWHPRPDFRGVARYITARGTADDAIVVVGGYATNTLDYYYDGPARLFGLPYDTRILDTTQSVDLHALEILQRETSDRKRLWLVLWQQQLGDPTDLIQSILVESCRRLPVDARFTNVGVLLFDLTTCGPLDRLATPPTPLGIPFQAPIRLLGYDIRATGATWEVDLWWETDGQLSEDYRVFMHLLGPDGALLAQHDHIAGADTYPTTHWPPGTRLRDRFFLDLPAAAATTGCPGCRLAVGLYTSAGRLALQDGGDTIEIAIDDVQLP